VLGGTPWFIFDYHFWIISRRPCSLKTHRTRLSKNHHDYGIPDNPKDESDSINPPYHTPVCTRTKLLSSVALFCPVHAPVHTQIRWHSSVSRCLALPRARTHADQTDEKRLSDAYFPTRPYARGPNRRNGWASFGTFHAPNARGPNTVVLDGCAHATRPYARGTYIRPMIVRPRARTHAG